MTGAARLLIVGLILGASAPAAAQDPIAAARELYASAAYEEALTALRAVRDRGGVDVARQADEYTAFCLLALGRGSEAEVAAEAAIRRNPLASIDARDASPRIEALFTQVRDRILPTLIREAYRSARDTMNKGDSAKSMQQLAEVRLMLDAAKGAGAWDDALGDISVLVDGFLELSRATAQRAAVAAPAPPPAAAPPVVASNQPVVSARLPPRVYGGSDVDVTPPVPIQQDIPEVTLDSPTRATRRSGVIEVTIDEQGLVQNAAMRESISTTIDAQLLKAARSWRYQPAKKSNMPVSYVKVIGIAIGN